MIELTQELAEFCGIHAGDGYMRVRESGKGEVAISGSYEEKTYYDNHVFPLIKSAFGLDVKGRYFSGKTYGFVCYRNELRDFLLKMGFPKGKKSAIVQVPQVILNSNDKTLSFSFLRGLFDTDGNLSFRKSYGNIDKFKSKYNNYPTIKITTISKNLSEGIIRILNSLDLNFYYYTQDSKRMNVKRAHIIAINGIKGLQDWMQLIGIKNEVKLSRYLVWEKFGFCPTNLTFEQRQNILKGNLDPYSLGL